jgi:serine/threonine protein kinase/tetratricopeptide (TPR) repeat protein
MPLAPGTPLGPYVVVGPLGAGGMGEVYRARDPRLRREVAIKVLPEGVAGDESLRRFETEARAAAAINHPNILSVHDVSTEGRPFVVFELLEGETLREHAGALSPRQAVEYGCQIARGLAAAHDRGVTHRDLKPDNVLVTRDGRVKILDFGLARLADADTSARSAASTIDQTAPGTVLGTSGYMAPEQVRGLAADHRADIFALGVLLYEMVTGQRAFKRSTIAETQAAVLRDDPPPAPPERPLAPALDRLVRRCLAKRPDHRFQSARDLLFALEAVGPGGDTGPPSAEAQVPSIAVLPFADMSPARDQDYFCEGLADELINALTRLRGVRVTSRTSSFQFRGTSLDVRTIGERLKVRTVLEGSVRKAGDRLRIIVQLVDAEGGYHLWSERYDRQLEDVFAIQDEIAQSVARALSLVLSEQERDALQRRPTSSLEAYEFYLKGRRFLARLSVDLRFATPMFRRAIELDPEFALAYAGLAEAGFWLYSWWGGHADDRRLAEEASVRALALAPELAEVHVARGAALTLGRSHEEAAAEFETAIRLNPRLWNTYYLFGRMRFAQGLFDHAEALWRAGIEVAPDDYQLPLMVGMIYRKQGRTPEREATQRRGVEIARKHLEANPEDARAMYLAAGALLDLGRQDECRVLLDRALQLAKGEPSVLYNAACVYARSGEPERALEALAACFQVGWGNRDWIAHDPDFDAIREDPRFQALLAAKS